MTIASRDELIKNIAKGKAQTILGFGNSSSSGTTASNAAAGHFMLNLIFNFVGTTVPTTLVGLPESTSTDELLQLLHFQGCDLTTRGSGFCRLYRIGTLNLAATGDQFTHDAAVTYPLLRTQYGAASQPIDLLPVLYVTTATTGTAPIIRMRTNAGGTGYVDQDGNNVVGAKTVTFTSATTTISAGLMLRMEQGDSGVRDIAAIEVTTAGSAGAATIFGMELLAPAPTLINQFATTYDGLFGGFGLNNIRPAAPTAGTVTSYLAYYSGGTAANTTINNFSIAVSNI